MEFTGAKKIYDINVPEYFTDYDTGEKIFTTSDLYKEAMLGTKEWSDKQIPELLNTIRKGWL